MRGSCFGVGWVGLKAGWLVPPKRGDIRTRHVCPEFEWFCGCIQNLAWTSTNAWSVLLAYLYSSFSPHPQITGSQHPTNIFLWRGPGLVVCEAEVF